MTDLSTLSWEELDRLRDAIHKEKWRRYGDPRDVGGIPTDALLYILTENPKHGPEDPALDCIRQELRRREGVVLPGPPFLTVESGGAA